MAESQDEKRTNENLLKWASGQGVVCDGVKPKNLPGRGRGMVATRKLRQGEQVISVPSTALLTVDCDPTFLEHHAHEVRGLSLHGQIAANLLYALVKPEHRLLPWMLVVPNLQEVKDCMPIFWPMELQQHLPESALSLLRKQQEKCFSDLKSATESYLSTVAAEVNMDIENLSEVYKQAWMLVNSRCFYWDLEYTMPSLRDGERFPVNWKWPKARQRTKGRHRDDCMALCPVIDCFNHSAIESCTVTFDERGFFVTCVRESEPGDELYVTYGCHSNDYLLIEYGFLLNENSYDHTNLDFMLLPRLSSSQQDRLKDENLLGSYILDPSGVCHRTQCALRILLLPVQKWRRFVSGVDDGIKDQKKVDLLLRTILAEYSEHLQRQAREARDVGSPLNKIGVDIDAAKAIVLERWKQIGEMLDVNMKRLHID